MTESGRTALVAAGALAAGLILGRLSTSIFSSDKKSADDSNKQGIKKKGKLRLGGIEGGGTSCCITIAEDSPTNIVYKESIPTHAPKETLAQLLDFFKKHEVDSLGIAFFGPVDLDPKSKTYGYVTSTTKLAWKYSDVVGVFKPLNIPIGFQTDVNAPAMAEMRYGKHGDVNSCAYITVGTGIGAGIVVDGKCVTGALHPECGHIRMQRMPGDDYKGNCAYHQECCEGTR